MSRTRTKPLTMAGIARDLAQQARERGGDEEAALEVFRRFLETQDVRGQRSEVSCAPYSVLSTQYEVRSQLAPQLPNATSAFPTPDSEFCAVRADRAASDAVVAEGQLWELLQRELDPNRRHRRGMFFTPQPLVRFIIRSVQQRLFQLGPQERLHIIDPACGYGGFLIEALQHVAAGRFTGFEVDGPTCEVARLLVGRESRSQQPEIIQVNPLLAGELLREAILGAPHEPLIPVIVGNPPWSNFGRQNRGAWINNLLADYRAGLCERKSNLADDSIKFVRWAQYWVEQAGRGIVALVTPNTWLSGLTHRRMRESLLATFDDVLVLDLHGESAVAGDENVFGVRSGVAVMLGVRLLNSGGERAPSWVANCRTTSLRGSRVEKFAALGNHTFESFDPTAVHPAPPDWFLVATPQVKRPASAARDDYASLWPLDRIFRYYTSGVQTKNDEVFVGFTREQLTDQVQAWLAEQADPQDFDARFIRPYLLAPFDRRFVYYDPRLIGRARYAVMRHMLAPNLGFVFMRQSTNRGEYDHFLAVDCLVSDRVFYSRHGAPFLAPLWLLKAPTSGRGECGLGFGVQASVMEANFSAGFLEAVAAAIGDAPDPRELFDYLYAVAHWPAYRRIHAAELRRGFPRFPLPADREAFRRFSELGSQLVSPHVGAPSGCCPDETLPPAAAGAEASGAFRLGGYDVLQRWAKPRRTCGFSADDERDLAHLTWIGRETQRLMHEIDRQSPDHRSGC